MDTLLQQAVAAARAGRRQEARDLLVQIVEADERNEQAWLWLSGVVDDPEDMRTCLENVLDLNPGNEKARKGLAWLETRYGPRPTPAQPPQPATPVAPPAESSYTGPTTRLDPATTGFAAVPLVAPPQPAASAQLAPSAQSAVSAQPAVSTPAPPPENPCPYCGAATLLTHTHCPKCHGNMMVRGEPREKRSVATLILSLLYMINGMPSFGLGLYIVVETVLSVLRPRSLGAGAIAVPFLLIIALLVALPGLINFAIARGLFFRKRWAYIVSAVFTGLGLVGVLCMLAFGAAAFAEIMQELGDQLPSGSFPLVAVGGTIGVVIYAVVLLIGVLLPLVLLILGYHDFYSQKVRFAPEMSVADATGHYNNGVTYKNMGMWYMAAKEWEAASKKAPHDLNYLHALGLAYAQIRQFDQARATLDSALKIDPYHTQIRESRALVDEMAKR